jgi:GH15 family glucan-1,4-alpha-glucosidase
MNTYPPISDYAYISDCHSCALVSLSASIDWCCMPRIDSDSCFGRLLDRSKGGYWQISPVGKFSTKRSYLEDTLVLETIFHTDSGEARLLDFFTMRWGGKNSPKNQILRIVEGLKGSLCIEVDIKPRFEYGEILPWIRRKDDSQFAAIGGNTGLLIFCDGVLHLRDRHCLEAEFPLTQGERLHFSLSFVPPEEFDSKEFTALKPDEMDSRLEDTIAWWKNWTCKGKMVGAYGEAARRSAIVLKGLTNAPTGAIAAAPTTSLPEVPGGSRNWDYRFTWIRDSYFAVRSLAELGYPQEADGFRKFVERSAAGSADGIQVVYGVGGERRLQEYEIKGLEGYKGAVPVRVGNSAAKQLQLDVYGELLSLAWEWHKRGFSPDEDYWEFLVNIVDAAAAQWNKPDHSIWEIRGKPRHFVQSKVMCWLALDRGIMLAEELGRQAPVAEWRREKEKVRRAVEAKGYDRSRGVFIQAFGFPQMDAALLLLPSTGFIDYRDERMLRTTDAVWEDLQDKGLLLRYPRGSDGLSGEESAFLACSFWLAECLAHQGRIEEAHGVFCNALDTGNDLGLFSEEYDTRSRTMLGNFPQGFSHFSLIVAAIAIEAYGGKPNEGGSDEQT